MSLAESGNDRQMWVNGTIAELFVPHRDSQTSETTIVVKQQPKPSDG